MTKGKEITLSGEYNKVLMPLDFYMQFCRQIEFSNNTTFIGPDGSALQFILEELMTFGSTSIIIDYHSNISDVSLESLPKILKNRVQIVNKNGRLKEKVDIILSPLMEEFNCKVSFGGIEFPKGRHNLPKEERWHFFDSFTMLYESLHQLLTGIENKMQISINLISTIEAIKFLRSLSRNPHARANLSVLQGLFASYETHTFKSFEISSSSSLAQINLIKELIKNTSFINYSKEAHKLGLIENILETKHNLGDYANEIVANRLFKPIFQFGTKVISALTSLPMPDSELAEKILGNRNYLPPIISLEICFSKARETWEEVNPNYYIPILPETNTDLQKVEIKNVEYLRREK